jgi:hypothetical protein
MAMLCQSAGERARKGGRKHFFFVNKKEAKKTLLHLYRAGETAWGPVSKSFLLLFFKKEALSCSFAFCDLRRSLPVQSHLHEDV